MNILCAKYYFLLIIFPNFLFIISINKIQLGKIYDVAYSILKFAN